MENVRRYRAMASMCRQHAALDPQNYRLWIARADQWEILVEAEIEEHYRACNSERDARSALMTEADSKLQGLLPQRANGAFHDFGDLRYGCSRLRMLLEQFDVSSGVGLACRQLLFRLCQFDLLELASQHSTCGLVIK